MLPVLCFAKKRQALVEPPRALCYNEANTHRRPGIFNQENFSDALAAYKRNFTQTHWDDERYKWEAIKHFQTHWDIGADDFPGMLRAALEKTYNLLASANNFPRDMLLRLASAVPEAVRAAFVQLFDENRDLIERVAHFKAQFDAILEQYGGNAKSHYQSENAISTYLWLRYPDKYYIYKYSEVRAVAKCLAADTVIKKGAAAANLRNAFALYDELCAALAQDDGMRAMLQSCLTDACYPDPQLRTLTVDFGFYVSRTYANQTDKVTYLSEIIESLKALGGKAHLNDINSKIKERGKLSSVHTNPDWQQAVRAAIYTHCSENESYKEGNPDLFYPVNGIGQGIWGLRDFTLPPETDPDGDTPPTIKPEDAAPPAYTRADFLAEVYMSPENFDTLCALVRHRKNVILQGAPGVGKTYAAKRLAYAMMGERDDSRVGFVQFHQNYTYEDFIMGYKPGENGFALQTGIFYDFCARAAADPGRDYFFIIDEINRGNMSKIFGELLMLIEKDYRGTPATLAYSKEAFAVPQNVYLIGMMNTADRSLAMIDYALRRRFSFFDMEPAFDTEGFAAYQQSLGSETLDDLIAQIRELNRAIRMDATLGPGFQIGHSYFCNQNPCTEEWLKAVVCYDILPTLREYWFDDPEKAGEWERRLSGVFE